jgi:predicted DNA-binding transcriptional regulator AlpA
MRSDMKKPAPQGYREPPADGVILMRPQQVADALGVSIRHIYAMVEAKTLPPPRIISKKVTGWLRREVVDFAENLPTAPTYDHLKDDQPKAERVSELAE